MPLGFAAITERAPVIAYLGLGANLDDPRQQISEALERLNAAEEVEVTRVSTFYRNPPLGPANQPWYINAAARVRTRLGPEELLRLLQQVETALGRVRGERWGPRRLDLDLLLYNGEVIFAPDLVVPHPEMHRGFVLVPLAEIAPQAWHPVMDKSAGDLLSELNPADRAAVQPLAAD
jgi:2-amino-4-hydroxy-6-hydroxymethyldihydropteridine diphosphokinase